MVGQTAPAEEIRQLADLAHLDNIGIIRRVEAQVIVCPAQLMAIVRLVIILTAKVEDSV